MAVTIKYFVRDGRRFVDWEALKAAIDSRRSGLGPDGELVSLEDLSEWLEQAMFESEM